MAAVTPPEAKIIETLRREDPHMTYPKDLTAEERAALPEFTFRVPEEFAWFRGDAIVARYHPGQDYICTRQPRHDELRDLCVSWQAEQKIAITAMSSGDAYVSVQLGG